MYRPAALAAGRIGHAGSVMQILEEHIEVSNPALGNHIRLSEYHVVSNAAQIGSHMDVCSSSSNAPIDNHIHSTMPFAGMVRERSNLIRLCDRPCWMIALK
jgi:hypothetical protein